MECRAEINRFAIFLFCLLVPLGSMAPTETSESQGTTGQRLRHFTTEIPTYAAILQGKAQKLFDSYNNCISAASPPELKTAQSKGRDTAKRIPECEAFQANCCALHHIQYNLNILEGDIVAFCPNSSKVVRTNLSQLNAILGQGTVFYSCRSQDLPQVYTQVPNLDITNKKTFIWWVLVKYKDIMQHTGKTVL